MPRSVAIVNLVVISVSIRRFYYAKIKRYETIGTDTEFLKTTSTVSMRSLRQRVQVL